MAQAVEWDAAGTPRSPRFDDVYRSAAGGLAQARHVFLQGCGLPAAWAHRPHWVILETGFGLGMNFLATWRAWKDDPQRPRILHFVSIEAWPVAAQDLLRSAQAHPELQPLAEELARQWDGLLPGLHRMAFEGGHVLLTLCVGDVQDMLKRQALRADAVFLDGFEPQRNPAMWEPATLKAVARLCARDAAVATWTVAGDVRRALAQAGFQVEKAEGLAPKRHCLRGRYAPSWEPRGLVQMPGVVPARCAVIGGGLAGAAVAASLARRGWQVQVFDAEAEPAAGASGLPAGLMAPHQSPDDNLLSRLSRAGIRITLQQARGLLREGEDWQPSGALQHRIADTRTPPDLGPQGLPWTRDASPVQKEQAGLPADGCAWWHAKAAWIRPAALVRAWLAQPAIQWHGATRVRQLRQHAGLWQVQAEQGKVVACVELVVVAAAYASAALLPRPLALQPVRGQVSWSHARIEGLPPFPLNGNGHFLPAVPVEGQLAWLSGSTYGRGDAGLEPRARDHHANLERLRVLAPDAAARLAPLFAAAAVRAWTGVRCASADRRPLVGALLPGLWASTAMGSRGLSFAALCAELLAARLHGEPLPLERKLAQALDLARASGVAPA